MAVNTHTTLSPDIFTHEKRLCVLDVSFTLLETAGKPEFMSRDIGACWQEQYILPLKATDLQSQIFKKKKKNALCFIYLFITQKVLSRFFKK